MYVYDTKVSYTGCDVKTLHVRGSGAKRDPITLTTTTTTVDSLPPRTHTDQSCHK